MADPYVYEKTNVLRNIPGIKTQEKLDEYENTIANLALIKLFKEGFKIQKTADVFLIHKLIFEDVYEWAGVPRIIDIEKSEIVLNGLSVIYESFSKIEIGMIHLENKYSSMEWIKMSRSSLVYNLARYISELWRIHPFREGNTRTIATYLYFFMQKKYNYSINAELLKKTC